MHYRQSVAQLFPANFDFSEIEESEQRTISHFLRQLDDSWFVVPSIPIVVGGEDREIDITLLSADHGMFVVEVKGGVITLDGSQWKSNSHNIKNPFDQVTDAKYALLRRLKNQHKTDLTGTFVQHIVAFPDIADFPEKGAGPGAPRNIVFTQNELHLADHYLHELKQHVSPATDQQIAAVLQALKPSVDEVSVTGQYVVGASQRIDKASVNELRLLFDLDENPRIFLRGRAGTGKTFLAHHWARRALERGERTLFVCFNRALGQDLYANLSDFVQERSIADQLRVGSFHSIANALLGDKQVLVPHNASQDFWRYQHAETLRTHLDGIPERFDTIIIDEGQDFYETWISILEELLVDKNKSRFYITSDESQAIFTQPPSIQGSPVLFRLLRNVRSTRNVAEIAKPLGGAIVPDSAPSGPDVHQHVVRGMKEAKKRLTACLSYAIDTLNIPQSQILVLVPHNQDIDQLTSEPLSEITLVRWKDREEGQVACATMASVKGLERLAVIVTSLDDEVSKDLSYVALTRASVYLAVIGTEQFLQSIGQGPPPIDTGQSSNS